MHPKLKVLGLAPIAILALMAIMVSTAQAQFTTDKEHTLISGSQKAGTSHVFTAGSGFGGATCEEFTFSGTLQGKSATSLVLTPIAKNCKDSFGRSIIGLGSSLNYTLTTNGNWHMTGSLSAGITSGGSTVCTIVLRSPQTNNGITYSNLGGTSGIEITTHATNLKTTTSGGFFNCGVSNGEHTAGTFDGVAVMTGEGTGGTKAAISVD
jgi:hypothetical protein